MTSFLILPEDLRSRTLGFAFRFLSAVTIGILLMAATSMARTRSQEHQALGSLSSVGQVTVNNSPAPADATIFSGDTIRTGANGTATLMSSVEGSFQIGPEARLRSMAAINIRRSCKRARW